VNTQNQALRTVGIVKPECCHTLWHSFTMHMLESEADIRFMRMC
jgi:site-specific recombinase XerD